MATKKMTGKAPVKKYQTGGTLGFEKRQAKKVARAKTKAEIARIEGEGTVAQKRDNRAKRIATATGTARQKTPKSISTSTSTTDNRNSGNTINSTSSRGGAGGGSMSTSGSRSSSGSRAGSSSTSGSSSRAGSSSKVSKKRSMSGFNNYKKGGSIKKKK